MSHSLDDEALQSNVITLLRFPLMVGVVFIHAAVRPQTDTGLFYEVHRLFSVIIPSVSVPFFFFISGYLFFYKRQSASNISVNKEESKEFEFSWSEYSRKIKKRFKTLFIPYVFWSVAWILLCLFQIPLISTFFKAYPTAYPLKFDLISLLGYFWATPLFEMPGMSGRYPIIIQFWFIRDLMVLVVLSPILYLGIKKLKYLFLLVLFGFYFGLFDGTLFSDFFSIPGFGFTSLFFFILGAEYSIKRRLWLQDFLQLQIPAFILYPIFVFLDLFFQNNIIHKVQILVGVVFFANLAVRFILISKNKRIESFLLFLSSSSFFLFAFHAPWLVNRTRDISQRILSGTTGVYQIGSYFLQIFLCIVLSVGAYYFLKKCFPQFTTLITGGR